MNDKDLLDARSVMGMLKKSGYRDSDEIYMQKKRMLAHPRQIKIVCWVFFTIGLFPLAWALFVLIAIGEFSFGAWIAAAIPIYVSTSGLRKAKKMKKNIMEVTEKYCADVGAEQV